MTKSLLPPNSTNFERALESTLAARQLDVSFLRDLLNPDLCPAELLPYLAWALRVVLWNQAWDEKKKREMMKRSLLIRRVRGTARAVELAAEALGLTIELREWWMEKKGTPRTFSLIAWVDENFGERDVSPVLSGERYGLMKEVVSAVKPASAHFSFKVGARHTSEMALSCVARATVVLRFEGDL